jgi:hypothetical protein
MAEPPSMSQDTPDVAEKIRKDWNEGERSIAVLSSRYKLKKAEVREIIYGARY